LKRVTPTTTRKEEQDDYDMIWDQFVIQKNHIAWKELVGMF